MSDSPLPPPARCATVAHPPRLLDQVAQAGRQRGGSEPLCPSSLPISVLFGRSLVLAGLVAIISVIEKRGRQTEVFPGSTKVGNALTS